MSTLIKTGFFWLLSGTLLQNVSKLVIIAILSRLLNAEEFGVMTIATTVIGISELLTQISLGQAIVQLKKVEKTHISVVLTFSLVTGIVLFFLFFFFINPFIAIFFSSPILENILDMLVILFPLRSISQLSFSLLQREKKFKKIAGVEALSYLFGYGFIAVPLSFYGFGIWSLVYGSIISGVAYTVMLYLQTRYKLRLSFNRAAFNDLFHFGAIYSFVKVFNYGALKGDYFIIGKVLGAADLGLYNRAYALMDSVNGILGKILNTLLYPIYAEIKNDREKRKTLTLKVFSITFNLILPISAYACIYADEIIFILLGKEWMGVGVMFKIISISMIARVGYKIVSSMMLGTGSVKSNLFIQILYFSLIVGGTYISSLFFGLIGATISVTISLFIVFVAFVYVFLSKSEGLTLREIMKTTEKGAALTFFVLIVNLCLHFFLKINNVDIVITLGVAISLNLIFFYFSLKWFKYYFFEKIIINMIPKSINKWI